MFDGIIKLGNTFVKLCEAGSILFTDWKAMFFCNKDKRFCVQLDFQLVNKKLIGYPAPGLDVIKHIDDMCSYMENCLNDWINYIKKQRDSYDELNYFTMTQLVKLRGKMAQMKDMKKLDPEVFHLLHIVKESCNEDHLNKAMSNAWEELKSRDQSTQSMAVDEEDDMESREAKFIKELMDEDFSKSVATKALKQFGVEKFEEGEYNDIRPWFFLSCVY